MKRNVPVSTIMTKDPVAFHKGQKLSEVRKAMVDGGFHHAPVVDGTRLIGILSTTDLLSASYQYGTDSREQDAVLDHTVSIAELMSADPIALQDKHTVRDAAELLAEHAFHSVPITDDAGNLVGLVTTRDVLRYHLDQY